MKTIYILLLFALSITQLSLAQKKIHAAPIEDTKLLISAEADTISRVTFLINPTISVESIKTIKFPVKFTVTPFNELMFKIKFKEALKKIYNDNSANESFLEKPLTDKYKAIKGIDSKNNKTKNKALEAEKEINQNSDYLYNYFNAQLVLLFKYDNEPVAGELYYEPKVTVQFFESNIAERYLNKQKRNYHRLIKKLYNLRVETETKSDNKISDSIQRVSDSIQRVSDSIQRVSDSIKVRQKVEDSILNELYYFQIYDKISPYINNQIDIQTKKQLSRPKISKTKKNLLDQRLEEEIKLFFKTNKKEHNNKYIKNPSDFCYNFSRIIKNFKNFDRNKRMQLIYYEILELQNFDIIDGINTLISGDYQEHEKRLKEIKLQDTIYRLKNKLKSLSQMNDYLDYTKELISILNKKEKTLIEKLDAYLKREDSTYSKDQKISKKIELFSKNDTDDTESQEKKEIVSLLHELKEIAIAKPRNEYQTSAQIDEIINQNRDEIDKIESALSEFYKNIIYDYNYFKLDSKQLAKEKNKLERLLSQEKDLILKSFAKIPKWYYEPKKIQLNFNDGFIEGLIVDGDYTGMVYSEFSGYDKYTLDKLKEYERIYLDSLNIEKYNSQLKFENQFPYGFSSSKDIDDFKAYKLNVFHGKQKHFEMTLDELFPNYVQTLQNDRTDFSPKDHVVVIYPDGKPGFVELKKEKSSKLFNLSIYSDFNGLKETDPNGVLQFQFNKQIPLYTKRVTSRFVERFIRGYNYGYFNFIDPTLTWSRLDANDNTKSLTITYLDGFNGDEPVRLPYVTQLDLLRYENISVGVNINALSLDFPTAKFRFEINVGAYFGRTRVIDTNGQSVTDNEDNLTINKIYNVNTWRFYPDLTFRLRPEERYGATVHYRYMRFNSVTNDFSNISSEKSFTTTLEDDQQWLHQFVINAHFSPSAKKDDKFFFRYRYTNNANWEYNGFSELQVGYSMSLKF